MSERCPECLSSDICQQTPSDERPPWGCLDCDAEFEEPLEGDPELEALLWTVALPALLAALLVWLT